MTAQFNPDVRNLYEKIVKKNVVHNPRDKFEYLPERYGAEVPQRLIGGGRVREEVLPGNNGHYPPTEAIEQNHDGGFYGRFEYPTKVGSGRKCGGIGIIKHRVEPFMNELDMDYIGSARSFAPHMTKRPRLTAAIKQQLLQQHPELMHHHLAGGKIDWGKIWNGIKSVGHVASKAAPIIQQFAPEEYKDTIGTVGKVGEAVSGMGRAPRLTNAIKHRIVQQHPEIVQAHMDGSGRVDWSKLWKYMKQAGHVVGKVAPFVAQHLPESYSGYKDAINLAGKTGEFISGLGRKAHRKASHHSLQHAHYKRQIGGKSYRNPEQHIVHGAGFWQDFGTGFKKGFKGVAKVAAPALSVASIFQPELAPLAMGVGLANKAMGGRHVRRYGGETSGGMTMHRAKSVGHAKNQARGALVRQLMREKGMSLGQASSYIKQHNIAF
jgi:hypothetical protein